MLFGRVHCIIVLCSIMTSWSADFRYAQLQHNIALRCVTMHCALALNPATAIQILDPCRSPALWCISAAVLGILLNHVKQTLNACNTAGNEQTSNKRPRQSEGRSLDRFLALLVKTDAMPVVVMSNVRQPGMMIIHH